MADENKKKKSMARTVIEFNKKFPKTEKIDTNMPLQKSFELEKVARQTNLDRNAVLTGKKTFDAGDMSKIKNKAADLIKMGQKSKAKKLLRGAIKVASKGVKALPIIGGLAAALANRDASAAIPIINQAENLGPEEGSLAFKLESGTITPEERKQLIMNSLKQKRFKKN